MSFLIAHILMAIHTRVKLLHSIKIRNILRAGVDNYSSLIIIEKPYIREGFFLVPVSPPVHSRDHELTGTKKKASLTLRDSLYHSSQLKVDIRYLIFARKRSIEI